MTNLFLSSYYDIRLPFILIYQSTHTIYITNYLAYLLLEAIVYISIQLFLPLFSTLQSTDQSPMI